MIGSHAEFHAAAQTSDDANESKSVSTVARAIIDEFQRALRATELAERRRRDPDAVRELYRDDRKRDNE